MTPESKPPMADTDAPVGKPRPLFWLIICGLLFLCVPYLFMGESTPRMLGIPLWVYVSLGSTVLITGLSIYRIWRHWD